MDNAYNKEIRPILDIVDKILPYLKSSNLKINKIKLPKIVSFGMQSHGKSSTIESISNISLPKGDGTITLCPIKISLREAKKGEEYAQIKFEEKLDENSEEKYEKISLDQISEKILEYQNKVKNKYHLKETDIQLFDEVIQVEVNRRGAPNLTLIDLPGLTEKENLKNQSEKIYDKFIKEDETIVLLILSAQDEPDNYYVTRWMKTIPNYQKRFILLITKSDLLRTKENIEKHLNQINDLNLENKIFFIINEFETNKKLTYQEEIEMINEIPNINKYPYINKGKSKLINYLTAIQKEELIKVIPNLSSDINKAILNNEKIINNLPRECKDQKVLFLMLEECIRDFSDSLKIKKGSLKTNENGLPKENLMKYHIDLEFRKHIEETKQKMSHLFSENFCNEVTHNIIQTNSDKISILEDDVHFNTLIKPKIEMVFSEFETIILNIFDYMNNQIIPLLINSFGKYKKLVPRVIKIYNDYAQRQKNEVQNFYKKTYYLEIENVLTYNIDLNYKNNNLDRYIYYLLGKKKKRTEEVLEKEKNNQNINVKNELNEEKNNYLINNIINIIEDDNSNDEKKNYKTEKINSTINYVFNYKNENHPNDFNEFHDRIRIANRPEEILANDDKINNPTYEKFYDKEKYEFIPGFHYIDKEKLNKFIELIIDKKIEPITINTIIKMITYLEVMLNRDLDMIFLSIKNYLYNKLTDEDMINNIKNELHLIKFEDCKKLMDSPEIDIKRKECQKNLEFLEQAKDEIIKYLNNDIDAETKEENDKSLNENSESID